jgi:hypothetical protein
VRSPFACSSCARRARPHRFCRCIVLDRGRGTACLAALLAIAGRFGAFLFLTYDFQVVLSLAPLQAGIAFLPMSASAFVVATVVAPRLMARISPWYVMVAGFALSAAGMAILSRLGVDSPYLTSILPAEVLLGLGTGCDGTRGQRGDERSWTSRRGYCVGDVDDRVGVTGKPQVAEE